MKLRFNRETFLAALAKAEAIVSARVSNAPTGVLVRSTGDGVQLHATSLKETLTATVDAEAESGAVILPAPSFGDILRKFSADVVDVEENAGKLVVKCGKSKYNLTTTSADRFPETEYGERSHLATVAGSDLVKAIQSGGIAAAPKEQFPLYLGGVCIHGTGDKINIVSTDSRRVACYSVAAHGEPFQVVVPADSMRRIARVVGGGDVVIERDAGQVFFSTEGMTYAVRMIETKFPPYERHIEAAHDCGLSVNRKEIVDALGRASIIARGGTGVATLRMVDGGLRVSSWSNSGTCSEVVSVTPKGLSKFVASFNVEFLMAGLQQAEGDDVVISCRGEKEQAAIFGVFSYVIMPVALSDEERSGMDIAEIMAA